MMGTLMTWCAAVSQAGVAANLFLWYSTLGALLTSVGAWIVYLTGVVYPKFEPEPREVIIECCSEAAFIVV